MSRMGDAATWAALGTWVMNAIYIVILVYAIKQVGEARKLRKTQIRPFVVVDVMPGYLLYVRVENLGQTVARNVRFEFPVALKSSLEPPREIDDLPLFRRGLATLPPGKSYRVLLDSFATRKNLPMLYDVIVTYEDADGDKYSDKYVLDMESFLNTSPESNHIESAATSLKELLKVHKSWTDGISGIKVGTINKDVERAEERREVHVYERNRAMRNRAAKLPSPARTLVDRLFPDPFEQRRGGRRRRQFK